MMALPCGVGGARAGSYRPRLRESSASRTTHSAQDDKSFRFLRRFEAQVLHHHLQIFPGFAFLTWIAQKECRVVGHSELRALPTRIAATRTRGYEVIKSSAEFGHWGVNRQELFRSNCAQRNDHLWLDYCDLPHEKWRAGVALVALGRAIPRWAALHDIRDVDLLAAEAHGLDHVVEKLSSAPDERLALNVFIISSSFTNEHEISVGVTYTEDDLLAPLLVELTARAIAEIFADEFQGRDRV